MSRRVSRQVVDLFVEDRNGFRVVVRAVPPLLAIRVATQGSCRIQHLGEVIRVVLLFGRTVDDLLDVVRVIACRTQLLAADAHAGFKQSLDEG